MTGESSPSEKDRKNRFDEYAKAIIPALVTGAIGVIGGNGMGARNTIVNIVQASGLSTTTLTSEGVSGSIQQELSVRDSTIARQEEEIARLNGLVKEKEASLSSSLVAEVRSPALVVDGLKRDSAPGKSLAIVEGRRFYSEELANAMLPGSLSYSEEDQAVLYSTSGRVQGEEAIALHKTSVLYGGEHYDVCGDGGRTEFSLGGEKFREGFTICCWDYQGGGYSGSALFDLAGKYSQISFDVGRLSDENYHDDATLEVYLDGSFAEERSLRGDVPHEHVELYLGHAKSLKLVLVSSNRIRYGFANAVLWF